MADPSVAEVLGECQVASDLGGQTDASRGGVRTRQSMHRVHERSGEPVPGVAWEDTDQQQVIVGLRGPGEGSCRPAERLVTPSGGWPQLVPEPFAALVQCGRWRRVGSPDTGHRRELAIHGYTQHRITAQEARLGKEAQQQPEMPRVTLTCVGEKEPHRWVVLEGLAKDRDRILETGAVDRRQLVVVLVHCRNARP